MRCAEMNSCGRFFQSPYPVSEQRLVPPSSYRGRWPCSFARSGAGSRPHLHLMWPLCYWNNNIHFSSRVNITPPVVLVTQGVQAAAWGSGTYLPTYHTDLG